MPDMSSPRLLTAALVLSLAGPAILSTGCESCDEEPSPTGGPDVTATEAPTSTHVSETETNTTPLDTGTPGTTTTPTDGTPDESSTPTEGGGTFSPTPTSNGHTATPDVPTGSPPDGSYTPTQGGGTPTTAGPTPTPGGPTATPTQMGGTPTPGNGTTPPTGTPGGPTATEPDITPTGFQPTEPPTPVDPTPTSPTTPTVGGPTPTVGGPTPTVGGPTPTNGSPTLTQIDPPTPTPTVSGAEDEDGDGYSTITDCDDTNADVNPGATEACNLIDDDCDALIDEGDAVGSDTFYADADNDGFGDPNTPVLACSLPDDASEDDLDCDDTDPDINPLAVEIPENDVDEDCNGVDAERTDFNGDGYTDFLVVSSKGPGSNAAESVIYFGGPRGIDPELEAALLPTAAARAACVADFNDDGWLDIFFANERDDVGFETPSRIYWNSEGVFSPDNSTDIPTAGARDCIAADFNLDGVPDLAIANSTNGSTAEVPSLVFYSSGGTLNTSSAVELPTVGAVAVTAADLQGEQTLDLIFTSGGGDSGDASPSMIFWASGSGTHDPDERTEMTTRKGSGKAAVGRFNADSNLDLAFANTNGDNDGLGEGSFAYLGPDFAPETRIPLPTRGARGVVAADFDQDTYTDLAFANGEASTDASVYVYYGTQSGFTVDERDELGTQPAFSLATADADHDTTPDLLYGVLGTVGSPGWGVLHYGSELGLTARDPAMLPGNGSTPFVNLANTDGDDFPEAVIATFDDAGGGPAANRVYWNSPRGFEDSYLTEYPTRGAYHASAADLNADGDLDLIVSHLYDGASYVIDSKIFWGSPQGPQSEDATNLPTLGARQSCVGDLDADGFQDIVFANSRNQQNYAASSYIYWGSDAGYSASSRTDLPTLGAYGCLISDLDGDGDLDVVFPNHWNFDASSSAVDSYVYWNDEGSFSEAGRTGLPTIGANAVSAADLNADGLKELIFTNYIDRTGGLNNPAYIYWASPAGYDRSDRQELTAHGGFANAIVEDLNNDGFPDIVVGGNYDGDNQVNSYVYWGSEAGYGESEDQRTSLAANRTGDVVVGDLDSDGYPDIALISEFDGTNTPESYVYWGAASGYAIFNRTTLPTNRSIAATITDLDRNGFPDLAVATFFDGAYETTSPVFYADSRGLDEDRRTDLATCGAYHILAADFDNDGLDDLFYPCHEGDDGFDVQSRMYWNSRHGLQSFPSIELLGNGTRQILVVGER